MRMFLYKAIRCKYRRLASTAVLLLTILLGACAAVPEELKPFYNKEWGDLSASQPVLDKDFPDPDILKVGDTYYAFATIAMGRNIQAASSKDLLNWEWLDDAMPVIPRWALKGDTWAPDVTPAPDGSGYLMYFTAKSRKVARQCIGVARAQNPAGPYVSDAEQPLICQVEAGGSIDPASFTDQDGQNYLLWKNDGNCCKQPTWIYIQKLSDDGMSLSGEPVKLITTNLLWEGNLIEAPTLYQRNGKYFLFYSANAYYDERYAVGVATADSLLGPYTKIEHPILESSMAGSSWIGPGGQDIVIGPDNATYLAFHGWEHRRIKRVMYLEKLFWKDDLPSLQP
jgi:beta-xylosidase